MNDVECPYCGEAQEINHDDGYGYEEDTLHEQECHHCEKAFSFTTMISFSYEAIKAPCRNGGEHDMRPQPSFPKIYPDRAVCECCGHIELGRRDQAEYDRLFQTDNSYALGA